MDFSRDYLQRQLIDLPADTCCWVAYSGGVDSHALLHALAALRPGLSCGVAAVHVNHGLQTAAGAWDAHCRAICAGLGVRYVSLQVDGRAAAGESREAAARAARYAALKAWLPQGHCLMTAQHRDDQAETLLLQLLRGSGVKGLAAMPRQTLFGDGYLMRPLLDCSRDALLDYAGANRLNWVDDPSNRDISLDRNFLRHQVLPVLHQRWPAFSATLSRSARHCAEAAMILEDRGRQDLEILDGGSKDTLLVPGLLQLPPERQRNCLRHWLKGTAGTIPSEAVLARIVHDILDSRPDAEACVRWGDFELRRYRDRLYLLPQVPRQDIPDSLEWQLGEVLELPRMGGVLRASHRMGGGVRAAAIAGAAVRVTWRHGGERCRPAGRRHHQALKKLFQESGIPPWERERIPLVYIHDELAAVADLWVCDPFSAGPGEPGFTIRWDRGWARAAGREVRESRNN